MTTIINIVTNIDDLDDIVNIDLKSLVFNDYKKINTSNSNCEYVDDSYGDIIHSGNLYEINGKKYCFNCLVYHYVKMRKLSYS